MNPAFMTDKELAQTLRIIPTAKLHDMQYLLEASERLLLDRVPRKEPPTVEGWVVDSPNLYGKVDGRQYQPLRITIELESNVAAFNWLKNMKSSGKRAPLASGSQGPVIIRLQYDPMPPDPKGGE